MKRLSPLLFLLAACSATPQQRTTIPVDSSMIQQYVTNNYSRFYVGKIRYELERVPCPINDTVHFGGDACLPDLHQQSVLAELALSVGGLACVTYLDVKVYRAVQAVLPGACTGGRMLGGL